MATITFEMTDEQIDQFCTLGWTPKVTLSTGQNDANGNPINAEKDNVSKAQWVANRVVDYVNGGIERAARSTIESVANQQADTFVQAELAKISMATKNEPALTQQEIDDAVAAELG